MPNLVKNEVTGIRKFISFLSAVILLLALFPGLPHASAATVNSKAGAVTTSGGQLNVRAAATSSATVITSLKKGSYVTLISRSGSWWKVEYAKGKYGYCHSDYITVVEGTPVSVTTQSGGLNVRSGAGTSFPRTAVLSKGETVLLLTSSGDWSRVLYHGVKTGYVSSRYLSSAYPAVSVNVPSFKQMDQRWADLEIAESGKTMAQIGCATTAIAMVESFRTGTTITPAAMIHKLRYTPSGNVYWPEHYRAVTNGNGYLSAIYEKLKQGKPVLLGARNVYGSQHWVVVWGWNGGSKLTASGFRIHDPGSGSRTTLQQFLNSYPEFYKYFYF